MKKAVLLVLALSLVLSFAGCTNKAEETTTVSTTETAQTENTTEEQESNQPLAEFIPFECTGDYYSFDKSRQPVSENGVQFYCASDDSQLENAVDITNTIYYKIGDKDKILYKTNHEMHINAYVDNALYFTVVDNLDSPSGLYRIEISYDETGDVYNSQLSLVSQQYCTLVKAMDNSLVLSDSVDYRGNYVVFDTLTGEVTPTEYNFEADYSDYSNVAGINEKEALEIAKDALSESKYWSSSVGDMEDSPYFGEVDSSIFMVKPFYIVGSPGETMETYPDYAWEFALIYEPYRRYTVYISVNAVSGKVCYCDIQLND